MTVTKALCGPLAPSGMARVPPLGPDPAGAVGDADGGVASAGR
ncbi:hypothetical protein [Streptomyces showdoensis]|nr:hypothetical protein [Streptomyces showdoensis]